jgi:hypothetical protein
MFTNRQIFLVFFEHFPLPQGGVANIPESVFQLRGNKRGESFKCKLSMAMLFLLLRPRCGRERLREANREKGEPESVFGAREQYGNNLGRKTARMIPNDPKSALR